MLPTVNNAAMNLGIKYIFETLLSVLLAINPEVEFLGHIGILLSFFLGGGPAMLYSTAKAPFYIPSKDFNFPTSWPTLCWVSACHRRCRGKSRKVEIWRAESVPGSPTSWASRFTSWFFWGFLKTGIKFIIRVTVQYAGWHTEK